MRQCLQKGGVVRAGVGLLMKTQPVTVWADGRLAVVFLKAIQTLCSVGGCKVWVNEY